MLYINILHGKCISNVKNDVSISDGFEINLSQITSIYSLKLTCMNDKIFRFDCKYQYIGFSFGQECEKIGLPCGTEKIFKVNIWGCARSA